MSKKPKQNNDEDFPVIDDMLKLAVIEYYEWHRETNARPVRFVKSGDPDPETLLLVRFTSEAKNRLSSLMSFTHWKSGKWDLNEVYVTDRKDEKRMVETYSAHKSTFFDDEDLYDNKTGMVIYPENEKDDIYDERDLEVEP